MVRDYRNYQSGMVLTDLLVEPLRKNPPNKKQMIRIYNLLANDIDTVTPFSGQKITENKERCKNRLADVWQSDDEILMRPSRKEMLSQKYL